jgi:hypothetical protein
LAAGANGRTAGAGGLRLLVRVASAATEGGRRGLSAGLLALPAAEGSEIAEDADCLFGPFGTSIAGLITSVSRALSKMGGGGAITSAGTRT